MGKFKEATRPFQVISMDLIGPLPRSTKQNTMLLVVVDWFSKYCFLQPMRQATSSKITSFVENNVFLEHGVPEIVIVDNDPKFAGKEFKKLIDRYGIKKLWFNARYHPQNNPTERVNKVIGNALRAFTRQNHRHWDLGCRNSKHNTCSSNCRQRNYRLHSILYCPRSGILILSFRSQ